MLLAEAERVKVSLRSPLMLPVVALLDPELTYSLPSAVSASTGLDAAMPPWVQEGGNAAWYARLRDPAIRAALVAMLDELFTRFDRLAEERATTMEVKTYAARIVRGSACTVGESGTPRQRDVAGLLSRVASP
mgnify:CR=1 FL=1